MKVFLGIDTSCYTTSVAFMYEDGVLAAEARRLLAVKQGGRGLAQSEMIYQHTRNLPEVFAEASAKLASGSILAGIGVSTRPRPVEESYMPAFLVGSGYASVLALSHKVSLHTLSHQENHILAGIWSAGGPGAGRFLAMHVSGGTTELTLVERANNALIVTLLGGTVDISAGQLIDRIGVLFGLPFPAGPYLEVMAREGRPNAAFIPVSVKNLSVSFAGPETHARRLISRGEDAVVVAAGLESCIADSLGKLVCQTVERYAIEDILFVGGVCANKFVRGRLTTVLAEEKGLKLYFPAPVYSSDNAVGAAYHAFAGGTTA